MREPGHGRVENSAVFLYISFMKLSELPIEDVVEGVRVIGANGKPGKVKFKRKDQWDEWWVLLQWDHGGHDSFRPHELLNHVTVEIVP
jgi:hypothetical protein